MREELRFGRAVCCTLPSAESREWLVTNGLGGFASGTIAGSLTRRYHGLLVASPRRPFGRMYLAAKLDEIVRYDGVEYALATNRWRGGAIDPHGYLLLQRFSLDGAIPTWVYACGDALVEKRVWMEYGADTTYVRYRVLRARSPLTLHAAALLNARGLHATARAQGAQPALDRVESGVRVRMARETLPLYASTASARIELGGEWYRAYELSVEAARGLDAYEDHLHAASFELSLGEGESRTILFSVDPHASLDGEKALQRRREHEAQVLERFAKANGGRSVPGWVERLALAADQFLITRPLVEDPGASAVIAGYPWFGEWGRDTMIALPGLTLATGRPERAESVLRTFARYIDAGMLPNVFPDGEGSPQYDSIDAPLWYIIAVREYLQATGDTELVRSLRRGLEEIIARYRSGTRYGIHEDHEDGLIRWEAEGTAPTWMDAKIDGRPVTARIGKPIEINALWYNAQRAMAELAGVGGVASTIYATGARKTRAGFARYWNEERGFCYDVLDGPNGHDAALRPNQIFAVSLRHSPLDATRQRAVVDACGSALFTPNGLRSLAPGESGYRAAYGGTPAERDGAYHQGTAWGWLLGPWVFAHLRVYRDPHAALRYLEGYAEQLDGPCVGTLPEIAGASVPFEPNGAFAQAWSVGEVLRAWRAISTR